MTPRVLSALLFAAGAAAIPAAGGQPPAVPAKAGGPVNPPPPKPHVITLTVSAAAAPVPALKYELLPRLRDRVPGNAASDYRRAAMLRPTWPRDPKEAKELDEKLQKWDEAAVDQLPVAEVQKYLDTYSAAFRALDYAAKCDRCDWELAHHLTVRNIDMLLPEVQHYRELTRANKLRIRAALARNDFAAAAEHLRTGLRLGKDVGEGPILISMLVGIAITAVDQGVIDQWVGRPDAPNLYWALATLPHPFIDPRHAMYGESRLVANLFPSAKELETGPVSPDKANRVVEDMLTAFRTMGGGGPPGGLDALLGKLGATAYVTANYADAKKELPELGYPADVVEKMPPAQVVALRTLTTYRLLFDDQIKCFSLPYPRAMAELAKVRDRANKLGKKSTDPLLVTFALIFPAAEKTLHAHARTGRRFAGQQAVEAVRLHAAANGGLPPKALADVTVVPVPDDPYTGKPFEYAAAGNTFTLTAPAPAGEQPHAANSFRYEITIRGK